MEIQKGIEIIDLALYLKKQGILVISDTHIGLEEAMNKQGLLIPRFQFKEIILRLEKIFDKVKNIDKIIINGDIKHEFGTISEQEWRNTLKLLDFLAKHCNEIILIKGNHDTILGPIASKRNVKVVDEYVAGNISLVHGDKIKEFDKEIKTIVIGHEHPAISFRNRTDRYKCFLKGEYKKKTLVVMPSLNLVSEGTDIAKEQLLSPYLKNIKDFEVFVVEEDNNLKLKSSNAQKQKPEPSSLVLYFGKVKDIRNL